MKWTKEKQLAITSFRAIKRFAFFSINNCKNEYHWLKMYYILQSEWNLWYGTNWTNEFWMTKEEYEIWNKFAVDMRNLKESVRIELERIQTKI